MRQPCFILFVVLLGACKVIAPYHPGPHRIDNSLYRDTTRAGNQPVSDTTTIALLPWRQMFTDTVLQNLIQEGIDNNLDLKAAVARIREAQANLRQSKDALLPSLNAGASVTLQKSPFTTQNAPGGTSNISQSVEVFLSSAWEVDLWGKLRSAQRAELALLLESEANRRAVQTQLVSNIASNYYQLLAYDQELKITIATVNNRKEDVTVTQALKEGDVLTGAAVMQSQANVYSAAVTIPDIRNNIRQTENALCILLARSPGALHRDSLDDQQPDTTLRTGVPAQLLSNRPDVQEAEFQLRNSGELVNVARTFFYPSLTITAQGGLGNASNLGQIFSLPTLFGNIMAGLTQPIFNNGLNRQRLELALGQQQESLYNFQKSLLTAGQEVSNALYSYKASSDKVIIRSKEIYFLEKAVEFTRELMKYNYNTNYTDVLTSEQNLLAAQLNGVSDKLQRLQAVVSLYTSLGGGWR